MRTLKNSEEKLDEKQVEQAYYQSVHTMGVERLHDECIESFKEVTDLSIREWENVQDRCLAIHQHIPSNHLRQFVGEHFEEIAEEHLGILEALIAAEETTIEVFRKFNERLPEKLRATKLGEVQEPVYAEIFSVPEGSSDGGG